MARLTRYTQQLFGSSAGNKQIAKFGSLSAGSPVTYSGSTANPSLIQSLSSFVTGWFTAVAGSYSAAIQDMNAVCFLFAYQLTYLMQSGVAEWDSGTTYYTGDIVSSSGILYVSTQNSNFNESPTNTNFWSVIISKSLQTVFGSGYRGNFNLSSGTLILPSDFYFRNLTLSGTATIQTNGYKIFVSDTLDLSAAPFGAITINGARGGNGGNAAVSTGGTGGSAAASNPGGVVGGGTTSVAGVSGTSSTSNGNAGNAGETNAFSNGGSGGDGGGGGTNGSTSGGGPGSGGAAQGQYLISQYSEELNKGLVAIMQGGCSGGSGGSGGSGNGGSASGGSGASGTGGGVIYIAASTIKRGGSTSISCIQARGGSGGNAGTSSTGVSSLGAGGSGGGGGGGGGWIYIVCGQLTGSIAGATLDASGGSGGSGANGGNISGASAGSGGNGGSGANGGQITLINFSTGLVEDITGSSGSAGIAGGPPSGGTGGTGGAGGDGGGCFLNL